MSAESEPTRIRLYWGSPDSWHTDIIRVGRGEYACSRFNHVDDVDWLPALHETASEFRDTFWDGAVRAELVHGCERFLP